MDSWSIKQKLDDLEARIACDETIEEIKTLLRKYAMYFQSGDVNQILKCFASEREDVEVIFGRSKISGKLAIAEYYAARPQIVRLPGTFITHELSSEVITVANDGKTARVVADASGIKGLAPANSQVRLLGKYYFDIIKEADGWKIWHLQWILTADADFNYGWLFQNRAYYIEDDYPALSEEPRLNMRLEAADAYVDYFKPDEIQYLFPEPPEAYETWDGYAVTRKSRKY